MNYTISIITPTKKGGAKLYNVYNCIIKQNYRPKEWFIVLDGFDQKTYDICKSFSIPHVKIFIIFIKQNHKKAALNAAIPLCKSDFIIIADDDDTFPDNAIYSLVFHYHSLPAYYQNSCSGVTGLCESEENQVVGNEFPSDIFFSSEIEVSLKYRIKGEKWGMKKTNLLQENLFFDQPIGLVFESTVWWKIAKEYKTLFVNIIVRRYHFNKNGIINSKFTLEKVKNNCQALCWSYLETTKNYLPFYFKWNIYLFFVWSTMYVRWLFHCIIFGVYKNYNNPFSDSRSFLVFLVGIPVGTSIFIKDLYLIFIKSNK